MNQRGFTLIELLVTLGASVMILMAILATLSSFISFRSTGQHTNNLITTSERIFDDLSLEIQDAHQFTSSFDCYTLTNLNEDVVEYCYDRDQHNLTKTTTPADGSPTTYSLNPENVLIQDFKITDKSGVTTPDDDTPPLLEIYLKLNTKTFTDPESSLQKQTTISVRYNKLNSF